MRTDRLRMPRRHRVRPRHRRPPGRGGHRRAGRRGPGGAGAPVPPAGRPAAGRAAGRPARRATVSRRWTPPSASCTRRPRCAPTDWLVLLDLLSSPGMTNEAIRVYLARGLTDVGADERYVAEHEEATMTAAPGAPGRGARRRVRRADHQRLRGGRHPGLRGRARPTGSPRCAPADAFWAARPQLTPPATRPCARTADVGPGVTARDGDRQPAPPSTGWCGLPGPPGGRARLGHEHAAVLPARSAPVPGVPGRARRATIWPRSPASRSASSWPTCARATTAIRRCRPARPGGPSSPCAGCTASPCARVWSTADVAHEISPPVPAKRLPKAISVDDVERLLEAASIDDTPLGRARPGPARAAVRHRARGSPRRSGWAWTTST